MLNLGMKRTAVLVAAFATCACSFASANAAPPATPVSDMGRLSAKGSQAFDEIRQARLAIFSGRPAQATKLLKEAQASMKAAQADNTAFLKAESDLKTPLSMT
jgi:Skp family chaperone for outer membrane proteins